MENKDTNAHGSATNMIKYSVDSRTAAVAGAIAGVIREHKHAEMQAIGAGAVNQAVKAFVLAAGYLKQDGIDVTCVPEFADVTIEDHVRTAIMLVIDPQKSSQFDKCNNRQGAYAALAVALFRLVGVFFLSIHYLFR